MSPSNVQTFIASTTDAIGSTLTLTVPTILVLAAALIGLGISIHYIRRWIGRKA